MDIDSDATLAALQEDFPAFRITQEPTFTGPRYVATSRHLSQNLHTLITRDLGELRAVLAIAAQGQSAADPQPRPVVTPLPRRRPS